MKPLFVCLVISLLAQANPYLYGGERGSALRSADLVIVGRIGKVHDAGDRAPWPANWKTAEVTVVERLLGADSSSVVTFAWHPYNPTKSQSTGHSLYRNDLVALLLRRTDGGVYVPARGQESVIYESEFPVLLEPLREAAAKLGSASTSPVRTPNE